jgi:competence protein ComEA
MSRRRSRLGTDHLETNIQFTGDRIDMQALNRPTACLVLAAFVVLALLAAPAPARGAAAEEKAAKVNLNTAGVEELTTLPGIGPSYAKRIVDFREKNGPFKKVEDLLNVQGIGEKTLDKIRERVTVSGK